MATFKQSVIQVTTANTAKRFFSTPQVIRWGIVAPHASNTGNVFIGAASASGSEYIVVGTGDDWFPLPRYLDAYSVTVNSSNVSNQAVLLYITEE